MARDPYTTVRRGESLFDLARRSQTTYQRILQNNPNLRFLQGGQMLRVPQAGRPGTPSIAGYNSPTTLGQGPKGGFTLPPPPRPPGQGPKGGYTPPPPPPAPVWPDEGRYNRPPPPPPQQVAPKVFQRPAPPPPPPQYVSQGARRRVDEMVPAPPAFPGAQARATAVPFDPYSQFRNTYPGYAPPGAVQRPADVFQAPASPTFAGAQATATAAPAQGQYNIPGRQGGRTQQFITGLGGKTRWPMSVLNQPIPEGSSIVEYQLSRGTFPIVIPNYDVKNLGLTAAELIAAGYVEDEWGNWLRRTITPMEPVTPQAQPTGGGGGGGGGRGRGGGGGGGGGGGYSYPGYNYPAQQVRGVSPTGRRYASGRMGLVSWRI